MNKKTITLLLCLFTGMALAQKPRQMFLGVETGAVFNYSEVKNMDYIRGDNTYYDFYNGSITNLISLSYSSQIGIKTESFSLNDRMGFSAGVRLSHMIHSVGKSNYWGYSSNYFYFLFRQDDVNTEYLRVKAIIQKSDYVGIPLEFRWMPSEPHRVRMFFKFGTELSYLLQTSTDIKFKDPDMEIYQEELAAKVCKPKALSLSVYASAGVRIGRVSKPSVSIEAISPVIYVTSRSSGMVRPIFGNGIQINYQIPINSRVR